MFTEFRIKNYRTHHDSSFAAGRVSLVLGSNSAGKTNILKALSMFSQIVREGRPIQIDFSQERYRSAKENEPIEFGCSWKSGRVLISYDISIAKGRGYQAYLSETMKIWLPMKKKPTLFNFGLDKENNTLALAKEIEDGPSEPTVKESCRSFFRDLSSFFFFSLDPGSLRQWRRKDVQLPPENEDPNLMSMLRPSGAGLHTVLEIVKGSSKYHSIYRKFKSYLEEFDPSFRDIAPHPSDNHEYSPIRWEFNFDRNPPRIDSFTPAQLSDGFLRAAAIAFITSLRRFPAVILIDEIENGVGRDNIKNIVRWLRFAAEPQAGRPRNPQFILTSHNPAVLREFSERLEDVIHVFRGKKMAHSRVVDLNTLLVAYIAGGALEGDIRQKGGRQVATVNADRLVQFWLQGLIGGSVDLSTSITNR